MKATNECKLWQHGFSFSERSRRSRRGTIRSVAALRREGCPPPGDKVQGLSSWLQAVGPRLVDENRGWRIAFPVMGLLPSRFLIPLFISEGPGLSTKASDLACDPI